MPVLRANVPTLPPPRVDIITPCTRTSHLLDAYQSILDQRDIQWRWLIQSDCDTGALPPSIRADRRVLHERNPGTYGAALTRNRAMMRGDAPFLFALDDDDILYPGALGALVRSLAQPQASDCYGAWGETYTFRTGENRKLFRSWPATGILPSGSIADPFTAGKELLIHCGALLWRRTHLTALGGWAGLVHSEDTNLLIAADSAFPSYYIARPVYGYRQGSDGQVTASAQFLSESALRRSFTRERARMLKKLLAKDTTTL